METYTLRELGAVNIDAWVEAISKLADDHGHEIAGYNPDINCPAEFESAFDDLAERLGVRYDAAGNVINTQAE